MFAQAHALLTLELTLLVSLVIVVPIFIVALNVWARHPVQALEPLPGRASERLADGALPEPLSAEPSLPMSDYARAMVVAARGNGFLPVGAYRLAGGAKQRIRFDMLLSADSMILASVQGGMVGAVPFQGTTLSTRFVEGPALETSDMRVMRGNVSEIAVAEVLPDATFEDLLAFHRKWVAGSASTPVPQSDDILGAEHQAYRMRTLDHVVSRGLARYRDDDHKFWSFTARGVLSSLGRGMLRAMASPFLPLPGRKQTQPGEPGYVPRVRATGGSAFLRIVKRAFQCLLLGGVISIAMSFVLSGTRRLVLNRQLSELVPLLGVFGMLAAAMGFLGWSVCSRRERLVRVRYIVE